MRAVRQSPKMYKVIIHSAIKAWKAVGSRRMYLMQLNGFETDVIAGKKPEAVAADDQAMCSTLSRAVTTTPCSPLRIEGPNYGEMYFDWLCARLIIISRRAISAC